MIPKTILQNIKGSILPSIWQRVLIMMLFALMVTVLYLKGFETLSQPVFASLIPGVVLGLLLVFRTNTAYERFWEGRKLVGGIVIGSRQLSRQILVTIPGDSPEDYADKQNVTRLFVAFFVALKLHLRQEPIDEQLSQLVSEEQASILRNTDKMPLKIIQWINDRMMYWYRKNYIDSHLLSNYIVILDQLVERMAGCERIRNTPVPKAYSMHLNHLLLLYCIVIPFQLVETLGWLTPLAAGVISFTLIGIEAIGEEIENPFGRDLNDIPLDNMCNNLQRELEDLYQ
jgi:ion channel-forming bestrophin family protein